MQQHARRARHTRGVSARRPNPAKAPATQAFSLSLSKVRYRYHKLLSLFFSHPNQFFFFLSNRGSLRSWAVTENEFQADTGNRHGTVLNCSFTLCKQTPDWTLPAKPVSQTLTSFKFFLEGAKQLILTSFTHVILD